MNKLTHAMRSIPARIGMLLSFVLMACLITGCTLPSSASHSSASVNKLTPAACRETIVKRQVNEGGIGGTGIRSLSSDQSIGGIGGTGIQTAAQGEDKAPPPGGIGGTGISGMVTAFGSICVNGFKIEYQAEQVNSDAPLAVGQVVNVVADASEHGWVARRVVQEILVSGPIIELQSKNHLLKVMEQMVIIDPSVRVADASGKRIDHRSLSEGDDIYVSGFRRSDGSILATFIGLYNDSRPATIVGRAQEIAPGILRIGGQIVSYPSNPALSLPARVRVSGAWDGNELKAQEVRIIRAFGEETLSALSVQGFFQPDNGDGITLPDGTHVNTSATRAKSLSAYQQKPVIIDAVASPDKSYMLNALYQLNIDGGDGGEGGQGDDDHGSNDGGDGDEGGDDGGDDGGSGDSND